MIGHLRGTILEKHPNEAIVEAGGVGYAVQIPISTYTTLPEAGSVAALRVHTHVREDAIVLFGFATRLEQNVFEKLITVSGIGPKLALTVLSGLPTDDLITAIRSSDVPRLVRIPGVGKKTAERMVLELKEKLIGIEGGPAAATSTVAGPAFSALEEDVLSALQNLGCSRVAAEQAVRKVSEKGAPGNFETYFRAAMAQVR